MNFDWNNFLQWVVSIIGAITGSSSLIRSYLEKPKIILESKVEQYDLEKGHNTYIHPVNRLAISITNKSDRPLTIRAIEFIYKTEDEAAKQVYSSWAYGNWKSLKNVTLTKSEYREFFLRYMKKNEKMLIDNLVGIQLVSSYNQKYALDAEELKTAVAKLQKLPPSDPDNLAVDFSSRT